MSCVTPDLLDLYWSLLSPYLDGEVPFQHGTNDPADCISELLGLKPNYPDEFLHNDPSSQKKCKNAQCTGKYWKLSISY